MDITLYEHRPTRSARVRWTLEEAGLAFDSVDRIVIRRLGEDRLIASALGVLLEDDGVGPGRHRRAGEDAARGAGGQRPIAGVARPHLIDDRQRDAGSGDVGGAHRVAVHGRVVPRGQQAPRDDRRGEHAPGGLGELDALGRARLDALEHAGEGFVDRDHEGSDSGANAGSLGRAGGERNRSHRPS